MEKRQRQLEKKREKKNKEAQRRQERAQRRGRTPVLVSNALQKLITRIHEEPDASAKMAKIEQQFGAALVAMREIKPGADRARSIHAKLDELIAEDRDALPEREKELSCKKGCSFCCNIQVMISQDEGELLYEVAKRDGIYLDVEKLEEQSKWSVDDYSKNYSSRKSSCVFLDAAGECKVYEDRPMSCRTYLVASPPELCNPERAQYVRVFSMPIPNIFEAAALNLNPKERPAVERTIPGELLRNIKKEKQK